MYKRNKQYEDVMMKLKPIELVVDIINDKLERIETCLNLLAKRQNDINDFIIKDNKKYYIKVTNEYLNMRKIDVEFPYILNDNYENEDYKTKFTLEEIEKLKQDKRLNWLNWDEVTLEEVLDNETK